MFTRIAASVAFGTAVTFMLLFVMQAMVASGRGDMNQAREFRVDSFVMVEPSQTVQKKTRQVQELPEPAPQPSLPRPQSQMNFDTELQIAMARPMIRTEMNVSRTGFGVSDGEYLPIVKVAPVYPTRALARKLEGQVLVEFVVTTNGTVKDVTVVESTAEIFEKAAVEAALKFKYRPRVVNGEPVEVRGVRNLITFAMEA